MYFRYLSYKYFISIPSVIVNNNQQNKFKIDFFMNFLHSSQDLNAL